MKCPLQSRVAIRTTVVTPSVNRKHPSHFIAKADGEILYFPRLPDKTPIILPDSVKKPKVVGTFDMYIVYLYQSKVAGFTGRQVVTSLEGLHGLNEIFNPIETSTDSLKMFREDLPLAPCNQLLHISSFEITDSKCDYEEFKYDCIDEICRTYGIIEIMTIEYGKVKISEEVLWKNQFSKIAGTNLCVRDNNDFFASPMVDQYY